MSYWLTKQTDLPYLYCLNAKVLSCKETSLKLKIYFNNIKMTYNDWWHKTELNIVYCMILIVKNIFLVLFMIIIDIQPTWNGVQTLFVYQFWHWHWQLSFLDSHLCSMLFHATCNRLFRYFELFFLYLYENGFNYCSFDIKPMCELCSKIPTQCTKTITCWGNWKCAPTSTSVDFSRGELLIPILVTGEILIITNYYSSSWKHLFLFPDKSTRFSLQKLFCLITRQYSNFWYNKKIRVSEYLHSMWLFHFKSTPNT